MLLLSIFLFGHAREVASFLLLPPACIPTSAISTDSTRPVASRTAARSIRTQHRLQLRLPHPWAANSTQLGQTPTSTARTPAERNHGLRTLPVVPTRARADDLPCRWRSLAADVLRCPPLLLAWRRTTTTAGIAAPASASTAPARLVGRSRPRHGRIPEPECRGLGEQYQCWRRGMGRRQRGRLLWRAGCTRGHGFGV